MVKFTLFGVSSVSFETHTVVYYHSTQFQDVPSCQKIPPHLLQTIFACALILWQPQSSFLSLWFLSLSKMLLRILHVVAYICSFFGFV